MCLLYFMVLASDSVSLSCVLKQQGAFVPNDYWYKFSQAASVIHWNDIE